MFTCYFFAGLVEQDAKTVQLVNLPLRKKPITATTTLNAMFQSIISISALPSPEAFVDAAIRVIRGLLAGQLLLHT